MASDSSNLIATPPEPKTSPWRRQLAGNAVRSATCRRIIKDASRIAQRRRAWRLARTVAQPRRHSPGSLLLAAFIAALALSAGHLFPGDPLDMVAAPFEWPGADAQYWLGTDSLGRDVAAGIAHGTRVSAADRRGVSRHRLGLVDRYAGQARQGDSSAA